MKFKSRLIEIAGVGLLLAFASSNAFAQGGVAGTVQKGANAVGNAAGAAVDAVTPSPGPWTTNNVTAARPFGTIDISGAGTTTASVRTWSQARTPLERNELSGRCGVINNPANTSRFPANAQQFCRNYITASANPAPGSTKTGKY